MQARKTTYVVNRPRDAGGMRAGIHDLAALMRSTLGPHGRVTASAAVSTNSAPELFESGGMIARRMYQFVDAQQNLGAMILRDMLLRVYDIGGDGVATASVLFQSLYDEGIRELAAGADPTRLQHFLHQGLRSILEELDSQLLDSNEGDNLLHVARTMCADRDLADEISRLFTILGHHGTIEVRAGQGGALTSTLVEGAYWDGSVHDSRMLPDQSGRRADIERCAVFVSDLDIVSPDQVATIAEVARQLPVSGLIIMSSKMSVPAIASLITLSTDHFRLYGVRLTGGDLAQQETSLADLSLLTGARFLREAAGETIASLQPADLGHSRRAWITRTQFGFISPSGESKMIRRQVADLRRRFALVEEEKRTAISRRISRFTSSSAILWVSGANVDAIERRIELSNRTISSVRGCLANGALPGAGAALLACKPRLNRELVAAQDKDQQAALRALLRTVEAPARAIAANSGSDASVAIDRADRAGSGFALNAITGKVEDVVQSGILDSYLAYRIAVRLAISGAAQTLTIDTVVIQRSIHDAQGKFV